MIWDLYHFICFDGLYTSKVFKIVNLNIVFFYKFDIFIKLSFFIYHMAYAINAFL